MNLRPRKIYIFIISLCFVFSSTEALADFYSYRDANGVLHISNSKKNSEYKWLKAERGQKKTTSSSIDKLVSIASKKYGVDAVLIKAVIKAESNFNPKAVSPKGAKGLMQLMPGTAELMGVKNVLNPGDNVDGGVKYLKYLLVKFDWELPLALAAYNAGENVVLRYGTIPPYKETRNYVKKVLDYKKVFAGTSL
jgi:soluble lytic murein transglycosylase